MTRLVFVIGPPRGGTTLLMRMLHAHPALHARPEPHLVPPLANLGYYGHVDEASYDALQAAEAVKQLVEDLPAGEADYLAALRAYADTLYGRLLQGTDATWFVDKTPANALELPFLARLYPDAVYVVLTRHPCAVWCSYARSFFDDDWHSAERHNPILQRYVPAIGRFVRERPVERLVHVRYDDLVTDPEAALRRVCDVLDVPFDPAMLRYGDTPLEAEGLGDPIGVGQHTEASTKSLTRWTEDVLRDPSRRDHLQRMLDTLDDDHLDAWGYPRHTLWAPLEAAGASPPPRRRWDRHHLQRRVLVAARRRVHGGPLERALRRARFYIDVLLR